MERRFDQTLGDSTRPNALGNAMIAQTVADVLVNAPRETVDHD